MFKINNITWQIVEVPQKQFWKDSNNLENMNNNEHYYGRTKNNLQEIWIDKDISEELKRKTLYHELMHCYIESYICLYDLDNQSEEFWCDLTANSHDIIHSIVEEYFGNKM